MRTKRMTFKGTHVRVPKRRSWTVPDGGKGLLLPSTNGGLRARKGARERENSQGVAGTRRRRRLAAPRRPRRELGNPLCTTPLDTTAFLTSPPSRTTRSCLRDVCIPRCVISFPSSFYGAVRALSLFRKVRCNQVQRENSEGQRGAREKKRNSGGRSQLAPGCSRESSRVETVSDIAVSIFLSLHHFFEERRDCLGIRGTTFDRYHRWYGFASILTRGGTRSTPSIFMLHTTWYNMISDISI